MGGGPDIPNRPSRASPQIENVSTTTGQFLKPKKEFVVLVTGFGPFPDGGGGRFTSNTSHLITKYLPTNLPVSHPLNPTSLPIRILNPTAGEGQYVKTEYAYIRHFIQDLYDTYQHTVDAIVHLGMADPWEWYSVEERAFNEKFTCNWWGPKEEKEGYYLFPDDAGKTVEDLSEGEGRGMWEGMPMGLSPRGLSVRRVVEDVMGVVNGETNGKNEYEKLIGRYFGGGNGEVERRENDMGKKVKVDVISHDEAGNYGCGFIYYESLATCWKRKLNTRVVFSHVPGWKEPERLERGADVVCAVIGAVCKQIIPGTAS